MNRLKTFFVNSIILTSSSFVLRIVATLFGIYLSNKISTEALGVFHLILSIYAFGITLASSGINLATTRIVSEELEYENEYGIKKAMRKCISLCLVISIVAGLLFFLNADFIVKVIFKEKFSNTVIYLISLALPFISICSCLNGYFTAVRKAYKNALGQFVEQFTKIAVTVYLLNLFFPLEIDYACFALILGDLISEIVAFLYHYIVYKADAHKYVNYNKTKSGNYLKRISKISVPVALTSYIRSGLSTFKHLIIPSRLEKSGLTNSIALSEYGMIHGMALPLILFPSLFITSFCALLIPEFSRYYIKKDFKRIKQVSIYILTLSTIFSTVLGVFLFVLSDKLALIFYNKIEIGKYIRIMCPLTFFMYVDTVVDSILKGLDAQVGIMIINIIDLFVTISIIYFVVPLIGVGGYILSIFISEIINFALSLGQLIFVVRKNI